MSLFEGINRHLDALDSLMETLNIGVNREEHEDSCNIYCRCNSIPKPTTSRYSRYLFNSRRPYIKSNDLATLFSDSLHIRSASFYRRTASRRYNHWRNLSSSVNPLTSTPLHSTAFADNNDNTAANHISALNTTSNNSSVVNTSVSAVSTVATVSTAATGATVPAVATVFEAETPRRIMPLIRKQKLFRQSLRRRESGEGGGATNDNDQPASSSNNSNGKEEYRDIYAITRKYIYNYDQSKAKKRLSSRICIRI